MDNLRKQADMSKATPSAQSEALLVVSECEYCGSLCVGIRKRKRCGSPECTREIDRRRNAEWRAQNPNHNREWKRRNAARHKAQRREYYERNRESIMAKVAAWEAANPERARRNNIIACATRRKRLSKDPETRAYADLILGDPCSYCGAPTEAIDHINPLSRGGADTWENLTAACKSCNSQKHAKPLLLFLLHKSERESLVSLQ